MEGGFVSKKSKTRKGKRARGREVDVDETNQHLMFFYENDAASSMTSAEDLRKLWFEFSFQSNSSSDSHDISMTVEQFNKNVFNWSRGDTRVMKEKFPVNTVKCTFTNARGFIKDEDKAYFDWFTNGKSHEHYVSLVIPEDTTSLNKAIKALIDTFPDDTIFIMGWA